MKKIFALMILVSAFCTEKTFSQFVQFANVINNLSEPIYSICETSDGNIVAAGLSIVYDGFIMKLDLQGNLIWEKHYENIGAIDAIQQTPDGGFICCFSENYYGPPIGLLKTNSNGDSLWSVSFYGRYQLKFNLNFDQTSDGGFAVTYQDTGFGMNSIIHLKKFSSTGSFEWEKFFLGINSSSPIGILETKDHGFIISGSKDGYYILKTDSLGIQIWDTSGYGWNNGILETMTEYPDSTLLFESQATSFGFSIFHFTKIDKNGNLIWSDSTSLNQEHIRTYHLISTLDGGFLLTGQLVDSIQKYFMACLKFNSTGQLEWEYKYCDPLLDDWANLTSGNSVLQSSVNQKLYMAGESMHVSEHNNPTLICLDDWALHSSYISSPNSCKIFSSLDGSLQIQFNQTEKYSLNVFDLNGKLIFHSSGNNSKVNENCDFASGVYLIKVSTKDFTESKLFPIVK